MKPAHKFFYAVVTFLVVARLSIMPIPIGPTCTSKIANSGQNCGATSAAKEVRSFILKLFAGDRIVIMNARFSHVKNCDDTGLFMGNVHGADLINLYFDGSTGPLCLEVANHYGDTP